MSSLHDIAAEQHSGDPVSKPLRYYEIYESALREEGLTPRTILEIGVYEGESTRVLAKRFPDARIVAVDLHLRDIDFSGHGDIRYFQCDQTDARKLSAILDQHLPEGIDLVVEDASHIGHLSRLTFDCVFPRLKPGGIYIIEDWGTGYWNNWIDGSSYFEKGVPPSTSTLAVRIPSHDAGMVGFVKSLVDYTATDDIGATTAGPRPLLTRMMKQAGRIGALRAIVDRLPGLKSLLARRLDRQASVVPRDNTAVRPALPRLKSVKFVKGVCIAVKA